VPGLQTLLRAVDEVKGRFLITADHGNAETMLQKDKKGNVLKDKEGKPIPLSSHTLVPVSVRTSGDAINHAWATHARTWLDSG
jgi:2,3-bisphosphoglycerate-independent phosphoglycerate mutase